jgi:hypothetical protein
MKFIAMFVAFAMSLSTAFALATPARVGVIDVAELEQRSGGFRESILLP